MKKTFLFVALDDLVDVETETLKKAEQLCLVNAPNFGFKVNFDYLSLKGLGAGIRTVQQFKRPVFADLKMNHGSRTMARVVAELVNLSVEYTNVSALMDGLIPDLVEVAKSSKTKILGLTVLSHFNDDYCRSHFRRTMFEAIQHFGQVALLRGCHGVIVPGTMLSAIEEWNTIKVATGIRPSWYKDDRHQQTIEPAQAVAHGADILVCGDPIMKDTGPVVALQKFLSEMESPL